MEVRFTGIQYEVSMIFDCFCNPLVLTYVTNISLPSSSSSTQDAGAPYRWTLGDGSTILGLEEAVKGMTAGGIRRVIIPSKLAYQSTSSRISKLS